MGRSVRSAHSDRDIGIPCDRRHLLRYYLPEVPIGRAPRLGPLAFPGCPGQRGGQRRGNQVRRGQGADVVVAVELDQLETDPSQFRVTGGRALRSP